LAKLEPAPVRLAALLVEVAAAAVEDPVELPLPALPELLPHALAAHVTVRRKAIFRTRDLRDFVYGWPSPKSFRRHWRIVGPGNAAGSIL
jgi:hypothetical protein